MIFSSPVTGKSPRISKKAFIAANATIIGDVTIEEGANIWYGAVLRGDVCWIHIGKNTSIQENVTLHSTPGTKCIVKDHVTVGHNAMIHGPCVVESGAMVGINAVVLQGTHVGKGAIIAAGATARKEIMAMTLSVGTPAAAKKKLPDVHYDNAIEAAKWYVGNAKKFVEAGKNHPNLDKYLVEESFFEEEKM